jgi:hypothetical protein
MKCADVKKPYQDCQQDNNENKNSVNHHDSLLEWLLQVVFLLEYKSLSTDTSTIIARSLAAPVASRLSCESLKVVLLCIVLLIKRFF